MTINEAGDASLFEECAAFHGVYASYVYSCATLAEVEAAGVETPKVEEVRRGISRRWQDALSHVYRVSQIPARTTLGLAAKGGVLQGYLAEHPVDDRDGAELLSSLLTDLANLCF